MAAITEADIAGFSGINLGQTVGSGAHKVKRTGRRVAAELAADSARGERIKADRVRVGRSAAEVDAKTRAANDASATRVQTTDVAVDAKRAIAQGIKPASGGAELLKKTDVSGEKAAVAPKLPSMPRIKAPKGYDAGTRRMDATPFRAQPLRMTGQGGIERTTALATTKREVVPHAAQVQKAVTAGNETAYAARRKGMEGPTSQKTPAKPLTGPAHLRDNRRTLVQTQKARGWAHRGNKDSDAPMSAPGTSVKTTGVARDVVPASSFGPERTALRVVPGSMGVERVVDPAKKQGRTKGTKADLAGRVRTSGRRAHAAAGEIFGTEGPALAKKQRAAQAPTERHRAERGSSSVPDSVRAARPKRPRLFEPGKPTNETNINFSIALGTYLTEHRYD